MIAKAKAISHGINDIRYITGESQHKKHPEKIYRVLDNLLPSEPDAMGIWNSTIPASPDKELRYQNRVEPVSRTYPIL
jgi:hypothetical protein